MKLLKSAPYRTVLEIRPFVVSVSTTIPSVIDSLENLYADYDRVPAGGDCFADFHIEIERPRNLRRWYKPQAQFYADDRAPFLPLPLSQAYPFFEWGLNWCIATNAYQFLIIHAAVVEKNGKALILCGAPGAGKSTLCAALVGAGWRLLSDEMAVVDLQNQNLIPVVRPISLKNASIDIIKQHFPESVFGGVFYDTSKGTVSHLKPPKASVSAASTPAVPAWVVFPQYSADEKSLNLSAIGKGETVLKLADNSFNYNVLGGAGFQCACDLVARCECYSFGYSNLGEALNMFSDLAMAAPGLQA